jgi:hypothetical protein
MESIKKKAYEELQKTGMRVLPSERLLQCYQNTVKQKPGFNKELFKWMKKKQTDRI